jgi:hypothetical protein
MTLSLLMYTLMFATAVTLSGVLVADAVRGLSRRYARRGARSADSALGRSAASRARTRRVAPTRS